MAVAARIYVITCRVFRPVGFVLLIMLPFLVSAQSQQGSDSSTTENVNNPVPSFPDSITAFDQMDLPPEMILEFNHLQPSQALMYRNEFEQMHDGVYGQAQRTIKVWYVDDHIVGYIIERPFDAAQAKVLKCKINIPVTWCCVPSSPDHPQHCVTSLAELRSTQAANKCTRWFVKLPDVFNLNPKPLLRYDKRAKKPAPNVGDFGHAEKTGNPSSKKKKGKQPGFEQFNDSIPHPDSTLIKQPKDSI